MRSTLVVAGITIRELLHEKVFYLLAGFAFLAILLSSLLGDLTYTEQSKITLDFLLAGIQITNLFFSVFMGITLLNRELNLGWIALVLSKPISRSSFLTGKFLGQMFVQITLVFVMGLLSVGLCKISQIDFNFIAIIQALLLFVLEGIVLSSLIYFFAVTLGALLAAASGISVFAIGNLIEGAEKTNQSLTSDSFWWGLKGLIPNFKIFNMKSLAVYGLSMDWGLVGIASAYAITCACLYFALACFCFSKRDIFT